MTARADIIVLGAGMVGVAAALHLQARGRDVILVDRRPAAEETSYGNAGLIQREGIVPYAFPRDPRGLLRYALNLAPEANIHYRAIPELLPFLWAYWQNGTPERVAATAHAARPLVERSLAEHEHLMQAAGVEGMLRRTGYLKVLRAPEALERLAAVETKARDAYGVTFELKTKAEVRELEPFLSDEVCGGILMPQPASVADPAALGKAYAALFVARGGRFLTADATTLGPVSPGWRVLTVDGPVTAPEAVVALGPWSADLLARLDVALPMAVKRGYHMHYATTGNAVLTRPVLDVENGYVLTPTVKGLRLTTGAEFARRDAPPTPRQLAEVEPAARRLFPLGPRLETQPWLGNRPCFPDMLPAIGKVPGRPGLWADFGHHHLGFTLGPVTGRLLAEIMIGEEPFTNPAPYDPARFR